jgi:non-heme chloroperoxidase
VRLSALTAGVPIDKTGKRLPSPISEAQLVVIEGGPHAIPRTDLWTHAGQVNTALLGFLRS